MSRYIVDIPTSLSPEQVRTVFASFAQIEGFEMVPYKGQNVYKKGMGVVSGPQYVTFTHMGGTVRIEAWIKFALLPGIYFGEMGVKGFLGLVPKKQLKDRVGHVIFSLQQAEKNVSAAQQ